MGSARVIGKDRVKALFAAISKDMAIELDKVTKDEAEATADAIRRAVPVLSGALKRSVRVVKHPWKTASYAIKIGGVAGTRKRVRKGVTNADFAQAKQSGGHQGEYDYTLAVEFGHIAEDGTRVPAEPFAYPTFRARQKASMARIRKQIRIVTEKYNTRASKG